MNLKMRLLSLFTVMLLFSSCVNKLSTSSDFLIKVDSIHCPDSVASNTSFDIEFFGIIGFDGCSSFKTFNQRSEEKDITIEAWGTYNDSGGACPAVLVSLDGQKLSMKIPFAGTYKIHINEPDNSYLIKLVKVKDLPQTGSMIR
jgi:hypothetical protein